MIGLGLIGVMSGFTDVPSISPMLATMIGLGVGIDYALFVVTRHRGFMHEGRSPVESAALANATSGTAVLFAGTTVVVALVGLTLAGIPSIAVDGLRISRHRARRHARRRHAAARLLGVGGLEDRPAPHRAPARRRPRLPRTPRWRGVGPTTSVATRGATRIGSFVVLVAIAAPVLAMRTGIADDGTAASDKTYRKAYDLLADGFGPGFNGPLTIALEGVDGATVDPAVADEVRASIGVDRRDRVRHRAGVQRGRRHGRA